MDKEAADLINKKMSQEETDKMVDEQEKKKPSLDGKIRVVDPPQKPPK